MATAKPAPPAAAVSGAPAQAGLVLATLIIVAAVANLPLAMANVALPSIGAYFDASQTQLNLVAVAYSLGLACSVLWLGALGDRYGRKQLAILGVALAMPAALHLRLGTFDPGADRRAPVRRFCRRHGLPDYTGADRGVVGAGTGTHALDRAVGGARRRHQRLRAAVVRAAAGALSLELGLFRGAAGGGGGAVHGAQVPALARQRDQGAGGQPRRHPLAGAGRHLYPGHQLCAGRRACARW